MFFRTFSITRLQEDSLVQGRAADEYKGLRDDAELLLSLTVRFKVYEMLDYKKIATILD